MLCTVACIRSKVSGLPYTAPAGKFVLQASWNWVSSELIWNSEPAWLMAVRIVPFEDGEVSHGDVGAGKEVLSGAEEVCAAAEGDGVVDVGIGRELEDVDSDGVLELFVVSSYY
jgi:hypothetical protein